MSDLQYVAAAKAGTSVVSSVLVEDADKRLVTYGSDGSFLLWELDPDRWITLACATANRALDSDEWPELRSDDVYDSGCLAKGDDRSVGALMQTEGAPL